MQAQPFPLWQALSLEMQLSPHAFPFVQILQQAAPVAAAYAGLAHGLNAEGPIARASAARTIGSFMVIPR